jgi:uncharacterized protein (TIGR02594 family)
MISRRSFLCAIAGNAVVGISAAEALAQSILPEDYSDYDGPMEDYFHAVPNFPFGFPFRGSWPALPEEIEHGRMLLAESLRQGHAALDIASFFQQISERNKDGEMYNAAWAIRWNPVIVGFYKSISLGRNYVLERGDSIPWCAAFANWCLAGSRMRPTNSASSASFRTHGKAVRVPQLGDIVVFESRRSPANGHVGFVVDLRKDSVLVLGGNQTGTKSYSSVCESTFPVNGANLKVHSYRSLASLTT